MKTNLSNVMKRAWEIKNQDKRNLFAICLKMAWEEERMEEANANKYDVVFVNVQSKINEFFKGEVENNNIRNINTYNYALTYIKNNMKETELYKTQNTNIETVITYAKETLTEMKSKKYESMKAASQVFNMIVLELK